MAKVQVKNYKQLEDYIAKKANQALDKCSDKVVSQLKKNISDSVYDWAPSRYQRTYNLLELIERTEVRHVGNRLEVEIYFDNNKVRAEFRMPEAWNAGASFSGDIVSSEELVGWLEYGTQNNPYYNHTSHQFLKETLEWLKAEFRNLFKSYMSKSGTPFK